MFDKTKENIKKITKKAVEETEKFGKKAAPKVDHVVQETEKAFTSLVDTASPYIADVKEKVTTKVQSGELLDDAKKIAHQAADSFEKVVHQTEKVLNDVGEKISPYVRDAKEKIVEKTKPIIKKMKDKIDN